jgi:Flp pilus assembly protein TadD
MANVLLAQGKPAEAEPHARTAVKGAAQDAETQNVLGAVLAQLGNFAEAIEHLELAVELDPNSLQAQGNLMAAYASVGRRDEAIAAAEKALALAREQGNTGLVDQINAFLSSYGVDPSTNPAPSK